MLVCVYTCHIATVLEITCHGSNLWNKGMSVFNIRVNVDSLLIVTEWVYCTVRFSKDNNVNILSLSSKTVHTKFIKSVSLWNFIIARWFNKHYHMTSRSGSEITPCKKIDKPLVVYRLTGNVKTSITTLRTKWQKYNVFTPGMRFQSRILSLFPNSFNKFNKIWAYTCLPTQSSTISLYLHFYCE